MRQLLHRFASLSPRRRRLVLGGLAHVLAVRLGLTVLPFARVRVVIERRGARPSAAARVSVDELAWSVSAVSRYVPRATCLTQALALEALLRKQGYEAELRIGVAKEDGDLKAHAWLEREGKILIGESGASEFTALAATGERA